MFSMGWREQSDREIELQEMDADVFTLALRFMYTAKITLTMSNVMPLIQVLVVVAMPLCKPNIMIETLLQFSVYISTIESRGNFRVARRVSPRPNGLRGPNVLSIELVLCGER